MPDPQVPNFVQEIVKDDKDFEPVTPPGLDGEQPELVVLRVSTASSQPSTASARRR